MISCRITLTGSRGIPPLTHMGWFSDSFFSRRREYGRMPGPLSGWSGSNRRHSAWKADVLPLNYTRKCGNKHYNLKTNKSFIGWILITSQAHPSHGWDYNITIILDCQASDKIWTCDLSFTKALLYHWATEAYITLIRMLAMGHSTQHSDSL